MEKWDGNKLDGTQSIYKCQWHEMVDALVANERRNYNRKIPEFYGDCIVFSAPRGSGVHYTFVIRYDKYDYYTREEFIYYLMLEVARNLVKEAFDDNKRTIIEVIEKLEAE